MARALPDCSGLPTQDFQFGWRVTDVSNDQGCAVPMANRELLHAGPHHAHHILLPGDHIIGVDDTISMLETGACLDALAAGGAPGHGPHILLVLRLRNELNRLGLPPRALADAHVAAFRDQKRMCFEQPAFEHWADSARSGPRV